jgi:hypothetical protein
MSRRETPESLNRVFGTLVRLSVAKNTPASPEAQRECPFIDAPRLREMIRASRRSFRIGFDGARARTGTGLLFRHGTLARSVLSLQAAGARPDAG